MKIIKYGVVILTANEVKVEGWEVQPELTDPVEATSEQMLLEMVIPWAQNRLNSAIYTNLKRISAERKTHEVSDPA